MVVEEILIEGIDLGVLMEGTGGEICEREVKWALEILCNRAILEDTTLVVVLVGIRRHGEWEVAQDQVQVMVEEWAIMEVQGLALEVILAMGVAILVGREIISLEGIQVIGEIILEVVIGIITLGIRIGDIRILLLLYGYDLDHIICL